MNVPPRPWLLLSATLSNTRGLQNKTTRGQVCARLYADCHEDHVVQVCKSYRKLDVTITKLPSVICLGNLTCSIVERRTGLFVDILFNFLAYDSRLYYKS